MSQAQGASVEELGTQVEALRSQVQALEARLSVLADEAEGRREALRQFLRELPGAVHQQVFQAVAGHEARFHRNP